MIYLLVLLVVGVIVLLFNLGPGAILGLILGFYLAAAHTRRQERRRYSA